MIVYVCSPLASATNGAALRVDGGVVRAIGVVAGAQASGCPPPSRKVGAIFTFSPREKVAGRAG